MIDLSTFAACMQTCKHDTIKKTKKKTSKVLKLCKKLLYKYIIY